MTPPTFPASPDDVLAHYQHPHFGFIHVAWETRIGTDYDSHPVTRNVSDHEPGAPAFYEVPWVYPATIAQARYGGTYEGAAWLAFPCYPTRLNSLCPDWDGDDIACGTFWHAARSDPAQWPLGYGPTPTQAFTSLVEALVSASTMYTNPDT